MRRLVSEVKIQPQELILPAFIREGITEPNPIVSMPGVVQHTEDTLPRSSIARWVLEHGRRLTGPEVGAVALLQGQRAGALGTVTDRGVIFLSPGQNVVHAPIPAGTGHFFWMDR
jgi:hypothetical protein